MPVENIATMKRILLLTIVTLSIFVSCKKSSPDGQAQIDYSGTYKGEIKVYTNGTLSSTLTDYSMQFTQLGVMMNISNNVFAANTGTINGSALTLNLRNVATSPTFNTIQTGTALFSAINVAIQFKEEEKDVNTNATLNTRTWVGTLNKQ